jgi:hypothetical protein
MEEFAYLLKENELADVVHSYWDDQEKSGGEFISYLRCRFKHELKSY